MRKFLVLAMAATLLMAGSAFAVQRSLNTSANFVTAPDLTFSTGHPATTNNADSCDIGVTPAATLLLPYFEVDTAAAQGTGATTLFTITNTSRFPQIAHVTLWTDWSFPVLDFNIFLTGYDVQGINLFDVIVRGVIAPPSGTSITTVPGSPTGVPTGANPANNTSNPNFFLGGGTTDVRTSCNGLAGTIQPDLANAVKNALSTGLYVSSAASCGSTRIGSDTGTRAKGYVTVDVASYCSQQLPTDSGYYTGPAASILFDNTLIGDYQQIGPSPAGSGTAATFDAQGNPMVHIRAIPEGGLSGISGGVPVPTNLPFTFYDRYTAAATTDRRVPLPNTFAARYIQGGPGAFATDYKIWREGVTTDTTTTCAGVSANSALLITAIVRFDEHENAFGVVPQNCVSPCITPTLTLPETSRTSTTNTAIYPALGGTDVGGWMYLNLSNNSTGSSGSFVNALRATRVGFGGTQAPPARGSRGTSQNWVVISMFGAVGSNRLSVDFDAAWLGNGCTPAPASGAVIAPAQQATGPLVCPSDVTPTSNCGVGTLPPAINP